MLQEPRTQGVVDRQRPLTGVWLGHELPAAMTDPTPANLALTLEKSEKKENGYEFRFRWTWNVKNSMLSVPENVTADVPNFIDLRVIGMEVDKKDRKTGTFLVTSTKNTLARALQHHGHRPPDGGRSAGGCLLAHHDVHRSRSRSRGETRECVRFCCSLVPRFVCRRARHVPA